MFKWLRHQVNKRKAFIQQEKYYAKKMKEHATIVLMVHQDMFVDKMVDWHVNATIDECVRRILS